MANLDLGRFTDEFKKTAPMECALYLYECLDESTRKKVKEDWEKVGGISAMPWWKWCFDNINVAYGKATTRFDRMIESFECDFQLAKDGENRLGDLDNCIKAGDEKITKDIELLAELSFLIRNGKAKIFIED